jgi:hypothetical protein
MGAIEKDIATGIGVLQSLPRRTQALYRNTLPLRPSGGT